MQRLDSIADARAWRHSRSDAQRHTRRGSVGFVPTMGALHQGHISLVRRSLAETDTTLVSIFLNPLQFAAGEDLARYPRDLDADLRLLQDAGVDAVFLPTEGTMYPPGFDTRVEVGGPLTQVLEAASRPSHFRGVTTVVTKLMQIAQADRCYFGMKDAQQILVLAKLVRDLAIPTTIVPVPTVRDPDGMALSSRNVHLSHAGRRAATAISRALRSARTRFDAGERNVETLRRAARAVLAEEPSIQVDYVSCAALDTLREIDLIDAAALLSIAATVGGVHLIDNEWLGLPPGLDQPHADRSVLPPSLRSTP